MDTAAIITLSILGVAIVLLLTNLFRADLIAMLVMISLGAANVLTPTEAFSGFSRSAVITVIALFILTNGLYRTGVTYWLGLRLLHLSGRSQIRAIVVVMTAGAILSWFMNTVAAGAVLLPAIVGVAHETNIRPSKLLMPLSIGALLGGMATLLTTATILVNAGLRDAGFQQFRLLDFLPVGGSIAVIGMAFMAVIGRKLLPDRSPTERYAWATPNTSDLSDLYSLQERLYEVEIGPGSPLRGKTIAESRIGETYGLSILAVVRDQRTLLAPKPDCPLHAHDVLRIIGRSDRVTQLAEIGILVEPDAPDEAPLSSDAIGLVEVLVAPRARIVGQTLKQIHLRQKFGLTAIALWRGGRPYRTDVGDMPLQFGDALLMYGPRHQIRWLGTEPDFIVLQPDASQPPRTRRGIVASVIMLTALIVAAVGWLPIAEATLAGALLMIILGCLSMDEAYQAIEWKAIFLIAGMVPLGIALSKTGAAAAIGQIMIQSLGDYGPLMAIGGLYVLAMALTQFVSGQATAVIMTPIALSAATQLHSNPYAFAMATALACSTAFLTPIAHPVNLLVMGPGGYTPHDFVKVGVPLTVVCLLTLLIVLPIVWPL
jgi:di/tricarboxylate transporter